MQASRTAAARLALSASLVEQKPKPAARLAADEDVLRHGQVGHQVQFLVDDADAELLRGARARDLDLLALEEDAPAVLVDRRRRAPSSASTCPRRSRPSGHAPRRARSSNCAVVDRVHAGKRFSIPSMTHQKVPRALRRVEWYSGTYAVYHSRSLGVRATPSFVSRVIHKGPTSALEPMTDCLGRELASEAGMRPPALPRFERLVA